MTNSANQPAVSNPKTHSKKLAVHGRWHTLDVVCTTLLTVALGLANCFVGFVCFLFIALSGMCDSGPCDSGDSTAGAGVLGFVLLALSFLAAAGGIVAVMRKSVRMPLVVGPLAGTALTTIAVFFLMTS